MAAKVSLAELDEIREQYRNKIPDLQTRKQMVKVLRDPALYAFLKGVYNLKEPSKLEGVYTETRKYAVKNEIDLIEFHKAIKFFESNKSIKIDSKPHTPSTFQITDEGKVLFSEVFDVDEFVIQPALSNLLKEYSTEQNIIKEDLNKAVEYILT